MKSIFKTLFLSLCIIANTHFAYAQTASILPQGKTQFTDNNGKPLASGTVDFYIPSTTTRKTTWQNSGETISNTNPVVLDGGGRAIIYGDGNYRMVVKDRLGNLIYDQLTSSTGTGSSAPTATGDGDLVGTIKPWGGMTAPNQYLFTYGQEISRTTYAALYTAITSTQPVFCNSGSPTLTGLSDTTNFWIGMSLEVSCVVAGFSTVVSKTSNSVTMAANANVSTNTTATFFPWGRGNGSTTFNLPDLRGVVLAGNNNMGGVASSNLTTTYFGATNPNSAGALGGGESNQLTQPNLPTIAITNYNSISSNVTVTSTPTNVNQGLVINGQTGGGGAFNASSSAITSTGTATTAINAISSLSVFSGGTAIQASIANAGSGYTNGSQTITVSGGTCTIQPQFTITVSGNVFTGTPALLTAGACTVAPTNPASTTGGGGTGGTLNIFYNGSPVRNVQPTRTTNYIIKVTPDSNSATASGVTSLGGMTGDIACGTGLSCTGNTISSVNFNTITIGSTFISGGTDKGLLYDNAGLTGNATNASIQTQSGYQFLGVGDAVATGISRVTGTKFSPLLLSRLVNWSLINDATVVDYTTLTAQDSTSNQYASFASNVITSNTAFNWSHLVGFEDLNTYVGSGTLTNNWSFLSAPTISGAVTTRRAFNVSDAAGVGAITTQQGFYCSALTRATTNWCVYATASSLNYLGGNTLIGTALTSVVNPLTVTKNAAVESAAPPTGSIADFYNVDGTSSYATFSSYGTGANPGLFMRAARGTAASPTQSQSGDFLFAFNAMAYGNAGAFVNGSTTGTGLFGAQLTENCTSTACGTKWVYYTTSTGSATLNQRAQILDGLSVGSTTDPGVGAILANTFIQVGTKIRGAGSAPALTSCGTSPSITGSDLAGTVTMGTGGPTGCIITFNVAYSSAPNCTVTWQATPLASQSYTVSTTAITTVQTGTSSNKLNYTCVAQSGG